MEMRKKVCFFAAVKDKSLVNLIQWYKNDIRILKELGFDVKVATRFSEIPFDVDFYFSWWATTSIFPMIIAKIRRKPIIVVAGGSEVVHLESEPTAAGYLNKPFIVREVIKCCLKYATAVISVSRSIKREADDLGARNNVLIYHGIDTEVYKPVSSSERNIIFTISKLTESHIVRKKIFTVIDAAKYVVEAYPNLKFVIAGAKSGAIDKVNQRIVDYGLEKHVLLPGRISEKEKLSYFSRSLIYLQPTIHEGFGLAIAEAMSCGVPVVTSRVAAVPEVVGDCGLYADPDDPKNVADKVKLLLVNDELRKELAEKGRQRIKENFSYEIRRQRIKELLDAILS